LKKTFLNKNKTLIGLGYEFLVICPHCSSCAKVIALDDPSPYVANVRRRFVCTACGATKDKVIMQTATEKQESHMNLKLIMK